MDIESCLADFVSGRVDGVKNGCGFVGKSDMKQRGRRTTSTNKWNKTSTKKQPRVALQVVSDLNIMDISVTTELPLRSSEMCVSSSASSTSSSSSSSSSSSLSKPTGAVKQSTKDSKSVRPLKKTSYRHIPHSEKPPHLVAKRNERERKRVQAVNSAFLRLRKYVPHEPRNKRLSKFKTLKFAIQYIQQMQDMIQSHDWNLAVDQKNVAQINGGTLSTHDSYRISPSSNRRQGSIIKKGYHPEDVSFSSINSAVEPVITNSFSHINEDRRLDLYNNNNNLSNITSLTALTSENRSSCVINTHRFSDISEYTRYNHIEPSYDRQHRYSHNINYNSQLMHPELHPQIKYRPSVCHSNLSHPMVNAQDGSSQNFQKFTHGSDSLTSSYSYFSDYSEYSSQSQSQTPSTSPPIDAWEDCSRSDISGSLTQDSVSVPVPFMEPIPSFHQQHLSFFDTGECYGSIESSNSVVRDCRYSTEQDATYLCDNVHVGFSMDHSSFGVDFSKSCQSSG